MPIVKVKRPAKYSSSRISTFSSCSLKYDLQYNKGFYANQKQQNVLTRKGNAFHEYAEFAMHPQENLATLDMSKLDSKLTPEIVLGPTWSKEKIAEYGRELEAKWTLPPEYDLTNPIARYNQFYKEIVIPVLEAGGKYHREIGFDFELNGDRYTGRLDILLEMPNGEWWIIDHKTCKTTNTTYYKKQLLLYSWALHKQYGIPLEDMVGKIKASVFFPFAVPDEPGIGKIFKSIRVTQKALDEVKDFFKVATHTIENTDWEPEANLNRMCEFCGFCGNKDYCPISAAAGIPQTRGVEITQAKWSKDAGVTALDD